MKQPQWFRKPPSMVQQPEGIRSHAISPSFTVSAMEGTIRPEQHFTSARSRWPVSQDERGSARWWYISGVDIEGDLIHECWTDMEPDPAIEVVFKMRG